PPRFPCIKSPKTSKTFSIILCISTCVCYALTTGYAAMPLSQGCLCLLRSYYLDMLPCLCPRRNLCCRTSLFVNAVKVSCSSSRHRDFLLSTSPSLLRPSSFASNQPALPLAPSIVLPKVR